MGTKIIQSEINVLATVTFLIYAATPDIIKYVNEVMPIGKPRTTSFITPAKKINPAKVNMR